MLIFVIYNESKFNANKKKKFNKKKLIFMIEKNEKRIMIFEFFTFITNCIFLTLFLIINFFKI